MDIPEELKALYKTVWEIKQKAIIDQAADRGAFICQSQSLNLFVQDINFAKLTSMHFYGWERGLKTGMYYLRTKAASDPVKFTVDHSYIKNAADQLANAKAETVMATAAANSNSAATLFDTNDVDVAMNEISCSLDNPDECLACGS